MLVPVGKVVAVNVFERKSDVAEGDFYRFGFKFRAVVLDVDELLLLFGEVRGEENLGVES